MMHATPSGNRIRIAFFGLRNAGKSTLVNKFTGQNIAIVSDVAGTTTDPVSKAMEILPLGPCLITDTAGLDDVGELGEMRVKKTLEVLEKTDIAVFVDDLAETGKRHRAYDLFLKECERFKVTVIDYRRGDDVQALKAKIAETPVNDPAPGLLEGLVQAGDRVLCVCPIDESAPKGRLILPQVQILRECLDIGAIATVCQVKGLSVLASSPDFSYKLIITDSQAFKEVSSILPKGANLTSFSILFARQKGDLKAFEEGLERIHELEDEDTVLIAEGCTHHRQCNDIGTVKIPGIISRLSGKKLNFTFASGGDFPEDASIRLIVQCGGCMLTRREMLRRIFKAKERGIPIVNYGMVFQKGALNGLG